MTLCTVLCMKFQIIPSHTLLEHMEMRSLSSESKYRENTVWGNIFLFIADRERMTMQSYHYKNATPVAPIHSCDAHPVSCVMLSIATYANHIICPLTTCPALSPGREVPPHIQRCLHKQSEHLQPRLERNPTQLAGLSILAGT